MKLVTRLTGGMIGAAALAIISVPAVGQETGGALPDDIFIEELIVTARKREESVMDVPEAITAFSASDLELNQVINLQDIRNLVPNLYLEEALNGVTTPKIFLRGMGTDNAVFSFDPAIGMYIDGVYLARSLGSMVDMFDVERVEFLRGPQGTLYGRNNSVAALRIFSRRPSLTESSGKAELSFGTEQQLNARLAFGMPLIEDKLGFRIALNSRNSDGHMTNLATGEKFMADDVQAVRAALLWAPSDNVDVTFRADTMRDRTKGSAPSNFVDNPDNDIFTTESDSPFLDDYRNDLDPWGTSITVDWDLGDIDVTSITAYRELRLRNHNDADGLPVGRFEVFEQNLDESQFTQEVYFGGDAADGTFDWVVGGLLFHEQNDFEWSVSVFGNPAPGIVLTDQTTDSVAVYTQATYRLTDKFSLTGGLRYTDEEKDYNSVGYDNSVTIEVFAFRDKITEQKATWKAAVDYAVSDDVLIYATAGTGFRSGGFNGSGSNESAIRDGAFVTEESIMYEVGVKADLLDRRLRINAGYFDSEYDNLQQSILGVDANGDPAIFAGNATATVDGFEFEVSALPIEGLEVNFTASTLNDEIKNSTLELKQSPGFQGRLGVAYTAELQGGGSVRVGASYSHTDPYFVDSANSPRLELPSYELVDAHVAYTTPNDRWRFTLTGYNLTDTLYHNHGFDIVIPGLPPLSTVLFPAPPRRWLLSGAYQF